MHTIERTFSTSTLHDAERMAASWTIASTTTRGPSMRAVPAWSPSRGAQSERWMIACRAMEASFASYILHLDLAGAFRHAGPGKWPTCATARLSRSLKNFLPLLRGWVRHMRPEVGVLGSLGGGANLLRRLKRKLSGHQPKSCLWPARAQVATPRLGTRLFGHA